MRNGKIGKSEVVISKNPEVNLYELRYYNQGYLKKLLEDTRKGALKTAKNIKGRNEDIKRIRKLKEKLKSKY